jgi:hypothetical protein
MRPLLCGVVLLSYSAFSGAADLVFRVQPGQTVQIIQEGGNAQWGSGVLARRAEAGTRLMVRLQAAGKGECRNGILGGSSELEAIKIPMLAVSTDDRRGKTLVCGDTLESASGFLGVKVQEHAARVTPEQIPAASSALLNQRILLGNLSFYSEDKLLGVDSLYVDLSSILSDQPTLMASFTRRTALVLGGVGPFNDASTETQLTVAKTQRATMEALAYTLQFESSHKHSDRFLLKSSLEDKYVPYQVAVAGRAIGPADIYRGVIPSGLQATDVLTIKVSVAGKDTHGVIAGSRLSDTLTAVVTPEL